MKTALLRRAVMLFGLLGLVATCVLAQGDVPFNGVPTAWNPLGSGSSNPYSSNPNSNDDGSDNNDGDDSGNSGSGGSSGGSESSSGGGSNNDGNNGGDVGNGNNYFGPGSNGNGGGSNPGNGGYSPSSPVDTYIDMYNLMRTLPAAHGALAATAFGFLFPLGSILMRVVPGRAALYAHAFVQLFSYTAYIAGAGLGLYLVSIVHIPPANASLLDLASTNAHPIIGITLLVALFFQPIFGVAHHRRFKKIKRRTWVSYAHLWTGRLGLTLGIINGGLGFALAGTKGAAVIAYAVVAGTMWVLWVLIVLLRKFRAQTRAEHREKIDRDAYVPGVRGGGLPSSRSRSQSPPSEAPALVLAEPDLPPYEPGPDYAAHTAHLRQTASRDSRVRKDGWEGYGSSRHDEDPGPIQSATDDEMRRGQV